MQDIERVPAGVVPHFEIADFAYGPLLRTWASSSQCSSSTSTDISSCRSTKPAATTGDANRHLSMNIDNGNQAKGSESMAVLGDVAPPGVANREYRVKNLDSSGLPLSVTTDDEGRVWRVVGTDPGFEGTARLYYAQVDCSLDAEKAAKLPATGATHLGPVVLSLPHQR